MGVTLHYRGRLRRPDDIQPVTDELIEICKTNGWKYYFLDFMFDRQPKQSDEPFYGITFKPHPESESVWMVFNPKGWLSSPFAYRSDEDPNPLPWSFTKTQYSGSATHLAICNLLRYLQKSWFAELEVNDETGFWKNGDLESLQAELDEPEEALKAFEEEYLFIKRNPGTDKKECMDSLMKRYLQLLKPQR